MNVYSDGGDQKSIDNAIINIPNIICSMWIWNLKWARLNYQQDLVNIYTLEIDSKSIP